MSSQDENLDLENQFDRCYKNKGGIIKFKNKSTESILNFGNQLIKNVNKGYPKLPPIYFNIIDNEIINAYASKFNNKYFIAITLGTIKSLEDLIFKLHCLKIEGFDEEEFKLNLISSSKGLEYHPLPKPPMVIFKKQVKNQISQQYIIIFKFLIYHEIGHILRGHVDFVSTAFKLNISEANNENNKNFINIMQTLEMDADSFATNLIVNEFFENNNSKQIKNEPAQIEEYLQNVCYIIYCFFRIFGFYSLDISTLKTKTHPPPAIRIFMIMAGIYTILIERFRIERVINFSKTIEEAEKDMIEVTYFDNNFANFVSLILNEKASHYTDSIMLNWKNIRSKLVKYSFSELPK